MTTANLLRVDNLSLGVARARHPSTTIIDDVSFGVDRGQRFGIVG